MPLPAALAPLASTLWAPVGTVDGMATLAEMAPLALDRSARRATTGSLNSVMRDVGVGGEAGAGHGDRAAGGDGRRRDGEGAGGVVGAEGGAGRRGGGRRRRVVAVVGAVVGGAVVGAVVGGAVAGAPWWARRACHRASVCEVGSPTRLTDDRRLPSPVAVMVAVAVTELIWPPGRTGGDRCRLSVARIGFGEKTPLVIGVAAVDGDAEGADRDVRLGGMSPRGELDLEEQLVLRAVGGADDAVVGLPGAR